MQVSLSSLPARINEGIAPLHLIHGPELLLVEEALDRIRNAAREQGYTERLRYMVEAGFDWHVLAQESQMMSLFSEKKLIELRMPSGKPGETGARALVEYANDPADDTALVVISGALDKRGKNTKWFKAVDAAGITTECPLVPAGRLCDWLNRRMSETGLKYDYEVVERVAHLAEGNLLAAAQEINLLKLLCDGEKITLESANRIISDHARFNAFALIDACLAGAVERALRILQNLKREGIEPVIILWALTREVRVVCRISATAEQTGKTPQSLFRQHGIWSSRAHLVNTALKRLDNTGWEDILIHLNHAELVARGATPRLRKDIWEEIESVVVGMCGLNLP